jgi:hypothetical protein
MGVCSYCYRATREECFGWDEAYGCCRITGPEDPKRLANKVEHDLAKARDLRAEADRIEADAWTRVTNLRAQAARIEAEIETITASLAATSPPP